MSAETLTQIRALQQELAEARATIEALLSGEIDAVVDSKSKSPVLLAKAQEALRASEERLRENEERTNYALGAVRMGLWEVHLLTGKFMWSPTTAALYGLTPEQAPTTEAQFFELAHSDDRQLLQDTLAKAFADGTDFELEFRALWPDGSAHWISGRATVLRDADGKPVRILGVNADIEEKKHLEEQLRHSQRLDAIGQLAGGVAHDFNNLLTAILLNTHFVIDSFGPHDPRRADMEEVVSAAQRATALTGQLLAFSRKQVLQPVVVDINALVAGIRPMLARLIGEHVNLVAILAPDLCTVRTDPGQIEQVLMNLVLNARDAMPSGGRLVVETSNVVLDTTSFEGMTVHPGTYTLLAVSDDGAGMSAEVKRHLFEPFYTTKEPGKGTGLGLAIVYGIVKQTGGYVIAQSEEGCGSTFKVYLPCGEHHEALAKPLAASAAVATGAETVLVVEDNSAVRTLTRRILERAGYTVFDAASPADAEPLFAQHEDRISLLVTDVIMPGLNGPKLYERLAAKRPELKVLYVSGYTDDTIVHQGQLAPGIEFLQKPFTVDSLTRRVRDILDR